MNTKPLLEITPLSEHDCFYLVDRYKTQFDFPIHRHNEIELNYIENCAGCQRVVGDSVETLDDCDLAIIGPGLEHAWLQNDVATDGLIREITIQFDPSLLNPTLLGKNPFIPVREMLEKIRNGIAFGPKTVREVKPLMESLLQPKSGFHRFQTFWEIIYLLATSKDYRPLATSTFANSIDPESDRRIRRIKNYITEHHAEELRLEQLASMIGMAPTAFSRFFKNHTKRTLQNFIIDTRIGHAVRCLVDTNMTASEICYSCGFNNLSNFNRLFKKRKGMTPTEFRERYNKNKIII